MFTSMTEHFKLTYAELTSGSYPMTPRHDMTPLPNPKKQGHKVLEIT